MFCFAVCFLWCIYYGRNEFNGGVGWLFKVVVLSTGSTWIICHFGILCAGKWRSPLLHCFCLVGSIVWVPVQSNFALATKNKLKMFLSSQLKNSHLNLASILTVAYWRKWDRLHFDVFCFKTVILSECSLFVYMYGHVLQWMWFPWETNLKQHKGLNAKRK